MVTKFNNYTMNTTKNEKSEGGREIVFDFFKENPLYLPKFFLKWGKVVYP
jgi:hypothetical protein